MNFCGYANKGCEHSNGCTKDVNTCGIARYFDFIVANSTECRNNQLTKTQFVPMWRDRKSIDVKCEGCDHIIDGYCSSYMDPSAKWPVGEVNYNNRCNRSTHIKPESRKKKITNALKASKRAGGRR
jgi:hypothetical protein